MLKPNLEGKTSKVTIIVADDFKGKKYVKTEWYLENVKKFLDRMEYDYTENKGEIHFLPKSNGNDEFRSLEEVFDLFRDDEELPAWLGIKVEE